MVNIRHFTRRDMSAVLELLHADQLPSQPRCMVRDVQQALAGRATIDRKWWEALATIRAIVATEGKDVVGVASYGWQKTDLSQALQPDGSGCLLWLHAREDRSLIESLLAAVLEALQACPRIYAFWFATPLTVGIEGLPFVHRSVTHQVLLEQQFIGNDAWLYMAGAVVSHAKQIAVVETTARGWQLSLKEHGEIIAEASISLGRSQIGVLHWLWVREDRRGCGLGTQLFLQASKLLGDAGAQTMLLFVDHDDPTERERDRSAAIHLYQQQGFKVVDHLWSYWRGTPPPWLFSP